VTRLAIATPVRGHDSFSGSVTVGYSEARMALARRMPVEIISASVTYGCDLVRARNRIVAQVLRSMPEITHVLWWDDDEWPEDVGIVAAMLATGKDLIGAPYTNKRHPVRWIHQFLPDRATVEGELLEVAGVGFGFTLTSRRCLEQLSAACDPYLDAPRPEVVNNVFGQMFEDTPQGRILLGEDFSFCKRWRDGGGKVYVHAGKGGLVAHSGPRAWTARDLQGGVE